MSNELAIAPTAWPVAIEELRAHCRLDPDLADQDGRLAAFLEAAVVHAERFTGRQIVTATRIERLDGFPGSGGTIRPGFPPLASVTSLEYVDTAGDTQALVEGTDFDVDAACAPARIRPSWGQAWPATRVRMNAVTLTYVCGTAPEDVPEPIRLAIAQIVADWFRDRESLAERPPQALPAAGERLLRPYAVWAA